MARSLPGCRSLGVVAAGQAVEGVQHGPRAVMVAGERGVPRGGPFEEHVRGAVRVQHQAEPQPAIGAEGDSGGSRGPCPGGRRAAWPSGFNTSSLRIRPVADGDGIAGMGGQRRQVRREVGDARASAGRWCRAARGRCGGRDIARRRGSS